MAVNNTAVADTPFTKIPAQIVSLFAGAMAELDLPAAPRIAVGVSGGADSLGLLLLLADWCGRNNGVLKAYTVDHNLRPAAREEARGVAKICAARGIDHDILTWQFDEKPETHIQERARTARYDLLTQACERDGFPFLAVAHHLEDQIETFWMRLTHGSGVDGLAGMTPRRDLGGVTLLRPLLSMPRSHLRDVCMAAGVQWFEDPSNENQTFLRPRLRGFEDMLAAEGLTPARFATTLQKLSDARDILRGATDAALVDVTTVHDMGYATLDLEKFQILSPALARRVLSDVLAMIAPSDYPPGHDLVARLYDAVQADGFAGQTAYGCDIALSEKKYLMVTREPAAMAAPAFITAGQTLCWDRRFVLDATGAAGEMAGAIESITLGALGVAGVAMLRKQPGVAAEQMTVFESLPGKVRAGLPALWSGEKLLSVPHLSWVAADAPAMLEKITIRFVQGFAAAKIV